MFSKIFFKVLERQNIKSNNISVTFTDGINQNILAVLRTFLNLQMKL